MIGYQLLTGCLDQGVGPDFAEDLREVGAPAGLIDLLGKCTSQNPDRRPRGGTELADALRHISVDVAPAQQPAVDKPPVAPAPPARPNTAPNMGQAGQPAPRVDGFYGFSEPDAPKPQSPSAGAPASGPSAPVDKPRVRITIAPAETKGDGVELDLKQARIYR